MIGPQELQVDFIDLMECDGNLLNLADEVEGADDVLVDAVSVQEEPLDGLCWGMRVMRSRYTQNVLHESPGPLDDGKGLELEPLDEVDQSGAAVHVGGVDYEWRRREGEYS